eukprot:TRINITY_DN56611_c0_g1_i1.p1 TRINITY_DN56611_c0_g1~~TRINITY_DN56611_c0_g1_i1.p1  ORF type:complete len:328 (-),score=74.09 TRINITY_DN56611_c0_g1_i1:128-1087(-)
MSSAEGTFYNEVINLFHRFDTNGDGVIGYDELRELLLVIGVDPSDISQVFDQIDTNKDGQVDWDEFVAWVWSENSTTQEALVGSNAVAAHTLQYIDEILRSQASSLEALFAAECRTTPNYLYKEDIFRMLLKYDANLTESTLNSAFAVFDFDGNGGVDLNEFLYAFRQQTSQQAPAEEPAKAAMRVLQYIHTVLQQQGAPLEDLFRQECRIAPGFLYKEECFNMLLKYDRTLSWESLEEAFKVFDWDGNGAIDLSEFLRGFLVQAAPPAVSTARQEVQVEIPAGYYAGTTFSMSYSGQTYYVQVPQGYAPGQMLKVAIG